MPPRPLQRNKRAEPQAVFNASGVATAIAAVPMGPSWELNQITVEVVGATVTSAQSKCTTFIGTNNSGIRISNTLTGNFDTDSIPNTTIRAGESVCAVWTGGVVGSVARMTVNYDEVAY